MYRYDGDSMIAEDVCLILEAAGARSSLSGIVISSSSSSSSSGWRSRVVASNIDYVYLDLVLALRSRCICYCCCFVRLSRISWRPSSAIGSRIGPLPHTLRPLAPSPVRANVGDIRFDSGRTVTRGNNRT